MSNIKHFESNVLKIDKKSYKNIGIYKLGYIAVTKSDDYENIYSVNFLYLLVDHASRYIEGKNENKYLMFYWKKIQKIKKYKNIWNGIKSKIEAGSSDECDYEKGYMKNKFSSDDDLPLNKPLKFNKMTIIIKSVFEEDGKRYPQVFLDDALYELSA